MAEEDVVLENYDDEVGTETEEVAEETEPKPVAEQKKEVEPEKDWRHQAFHEERERRKEVSAELKAVRDQMQKQEERFQAIVRKQSEPKVPTYDENPGEYLRHQQEQLGKSVDELRAEKERTEVYTRQQIAQQQFVNEFESVEQEYSGKVNDYYEAVDHLRNYRIKEYTDAGYAPQQATWLAQRDAFEIVHNAKQSGRNAAEIFYNLSKSKGYKGGKPVGEIDKLKELAENKSKATALGTSGAGDTSYTLADLASMPDEEFDKITSGDNWRKLWK